MNENPKSKERSANDDVPGIIARGLKLQGENHGKRLGTVSEAVTEQQERQIDAEARLEEEKNEINERIATEQDPVIKSQLEKKLKGIESNLAKLDKLIAEYDKEIQMTGDESGMVDWFNKADAIRLRQDESKMTLNLEKKDVLAEMAASELEEGRKIEQEFIKMAIERSRKREEIIRKIKDADEDIAVLTAKLPQKKGGFSKIADGFASLWKGNDEKRKEQEVVREYGEAIERKRQLEAKLNEEEQKNTEQMKNDEGFKAKENRLNEIKKKYKLSGDEGIR